MTTYWLNTFITLLTHMSTPKRKLYILQLKVGLLFCNVNKGSYTPRVQCVNGTSMVRNWCVAKLQVVLNPFLFLIVLLVTFLL